MPIIAQQHAWKDRDHVPSAAWPEDCYVQWGGNGVVLEREGGGYDTAFFEAFPKAGGFIRGEGETIAAAEAAALAQFRRESGCQHRWSRKDYTNGGTICRDCGGFKMTMKPIVSLGSWREPLNSHELDRAISGDLAPSPADDLNTPGRARRSRRAWLRLRMHGFLLPEIPAEADRDCVLKESPHGRACRDIICEKIHQAGGFDAALPPEGAGAMSMLFGALSRLSLQSAYKAWQRDRAAAEADDNQTPTMEI
ncbi:hypothetical protein [Defluviimonas salinarum]|uniref:Uncharacterized protein n=1 Tax=Defluviimonas salinarum TaxID=2992147 RepID=A0ABT3J5T8_9RHOB|nr:hypothetical protein [Defluviimonas salinarum]MCW3783026.1 hypothetical protein [Defluviimonas salinarum]